MAHAAAPVISQPLTPSMQPSLVLPGVKPTTSTYVPPPPPMPKFVPAGENFAPPGVLMCNFGPAPTMAIGSAVRAEVAPYTMPGDNDDGTGAFWPPTP
eukprot:11432331-Karenia_brevis.AAC.1